MSDHGDFGSRDPDGRTEPLRERYLDAVKAAVLNEHYLENELRIEHLLRALELGVPVDPNVMRDPARFAQEAFTARRAGRRAGEVTGDGDLRPHYPMATIGRVGIDALEDALHDLRRRGVAGNFVELGTDRGGAGVFMRAYLEAVNDRSTLVSVIDRFHSTAESAVDQGPDIDTVRDAFSRFGLLDDQVRFVQGPLERAGIAVTGDIALVRLGRDTGPTGLAALAAMYDQVVAGGIVIVEDLIPDLEAGIASLRRAHGEAGPLARHGWRGASWTKPVTATDIGGAPPVPTRARRGTTLTVVLVAYNMRRAARRTLHSLSRSYQVGIEALDYEVIVVENGSAADERLGEPLVESFGSEFRYLDMGDDAKPSPVAALNRGIAEGRGDTYALMIDGAHLLSPGVLRHGLRGVRDYAPAITAIRHWYLGPGQQDVTGALGYDEAYEDALLESIAWPNDGYGLFDIGQFIGEKDWLDRLYESNCLFVPRTLLERYGQFDEAFDMPGGGYANLDLFGRLEAADDVTTVSVIGEATFHQVHGGITTNVDTPEAAVRQLNDYEEHYRQLRGRPFHVDGSRTVLSGSLNPGSNRSRARRATPKHFFRRRADDDDGLPDDPSIVPEDLRRDFTEAFWRSLAWRDVTWLGRSVERPPNDLLAYQELLAQVRPDWVIQTTSTTDGLPWYLASVCELLGHGHVISITYPGAAAPSDDTAHSRLTTLAGRPENPGVSSALRERLGADPRALVVLGGRLARKGIMLAFEALEPLVPIGSYIVVENTVLNGYPVWRNYGQGPHEAVDEILGRDARFVRDRSFERFSMTFNPGGFLRRVE